MNRDIDTIPTLVERLTALAGGDQHRLTTLLRHARVGEDRLKQFSEGVSPTDVELEHLAAMFGSSPEYLGQNLPPQAQQDVDGLLDYLHRFGAVHLFPKYWHQVANQSLRGEGRMEDRAFRDLIRNENIDERVIDLESEEDNEFRNNETIW